MKPLTLFLYLVAIIIQGIIAFVLKDVSQKLFVSTVVIIIMWCAVISRETEK